MNNHIKEALKKYALGGQITSYLERIGSLGSEKNQEPNKSKSTLNSNENRTELWASQAQF